LKRKSLSSMDCPVALALDQVGEWWSLLILRDALQGSTRFEQFRESLDISPTMLTRRLSDLIEVGLLKKTSGSGGSSRDEYCVTDKSRDLSPVLIMLFAWGRRHVKRKGWGVDLIDLQTGRMVDPIVIDGKTGLPINRKTHAFVSGPHATASTLKRLGPRQDNEPKQQSGS